MKIPINKLVICLGLSFSVCLAPADASQAIHWCPAFYRARVEAGNTNKLIMADFYTNWCVWCKQLDLHVYNQPSVITASSKFVPVRVDAGNAGAYLASKYNIVNFPTILFLRSDGTRVGQIIGYRTPAELTAIMTQVPSDNRALPRLQSALAHHPTDMSICLKLTKLYIKIGDLTHASSNLAILERYTMDGQLPSVFTTMGDAEAGSGSFVSALSWYSKALVAKDTSTLLSAYVGIANCALMQGDSIDAKNALERALELPGITQQDQKSIHQMIAGFS